MAQPGMLLWTRHSLQSSACKVQNMYQLFQKEPRVTFKIWWASALLTCLKPQSHLSVPGTVKSVPASRLWGLTSPSIRDTVSQSSQSEPSVSLLGHATVVSETPLLTRPPYLSYSVTLDVSAGVSLVVVVVVVLCCSLLKSPSIVLCLTESSLPPFDVALSGASATFCSPPLSPAFGTGSDTEQTLYEGKNVCVQE